MFPQGCKKGGIRRLVARAAIGVALTRNQPRGASLGRAATVAVARFGASRNYDVPAGRSLSAVTDSANPPDLRVRDLRMSALSGVSLGAEDVPVLTLLTQGDGLALVLECDPAQLAPDAAIALLSEFAGRMHDPLRHLL